MATGVIKKIAQNKKARHEYFIDETYETGIVLVGTEVKSIRMGKVNLRDSYASIQDGEIFINSMHISPYEKGNINNKEPRRSRKLLMKRREINKLIGYTQQKGFTLVPLSIYMKGALVKIELALVRGKKMYDKRADMAEKSAKRDIERAFKDRQRY